VANHLAGVKSIANREMVRPKGSEPQFDLIRAINIAVDKFVLIYIFHQVIAPVSLTCGLGILAVYAFSPLLLKVSIPPPHGGARF
jgi:hypothetical protein